MDVEECRGCDRFLGLCISSSDADTYLRCAFTEGEALGHAPRSDGWWAGPRDVQHGPVSEIMTAPIRTVQVGTPLHEVVALLLTAQLGALPVLDDDGRTVGIITKTEAMARYYDENDAEADLDEGDEESNVATLRAQPAPTARDLMNRGVYTIPQDASISRAAALMAYEHVHHLLVVSNTGEPVGIVSTIDIARWVARADDFVVPRRKSDPVSG